MLATRIFFLFSLIPRTKITIGPTFQPKQLRHQESREPDHRQVRQVGDTAAQHSLGLSDPKLLPTASSPTLSKFTHSRGLSYWVLWMEDCPCLSTGTTPTLLKFRLNTAAAEKVLPVYSTSSKYSIILLFCILFFSFRTFTCMKYAFICVLMYMVLAFWPRLWALDRQEHYLQM